MSQEEIMYYKDDMFNRLYTHMRIEQLYPFSNAGEMENYMYDHCELVIRHWIASDLLGNVSEFKELYNERNEGGILDSIYYGLCECRSDCGDYLTDLSYVLSLFDTSMSEDEIFDRVPMDKIHSSIRNTVYLFEHEWSYYNSDE